MNPDLLSAQTKLACLIVTFLDHAGVFSREAFAKCLREMAQSGTSTEAAYMNAIADNIGAGRPPTLRVVAGGKHSSD